MKSVFILGRQPALGLAELESLYGADALRPAGAAAAIVSVDPNEVDFRRLGGSTRQAKLLTTLQTTNWQEIEAALVDASVHFIADLPEGKLNLGLSVFGLPVRANAILATGLTMKKAIRKAGKSVRLVPNKEPELNTAQVLHNNLIGPNGWELLLIRDGTQTHLAQTVAVQDIESYTLRDRGRPKRDARVGMLPPKLAQIIINLTNPSVHGVVLDPFCGTGVLLQEALLMGYSAYGSDLEPRMIEYTEANIEWLKNHEPWLAKNIETHKCTHVYLEVQDATQFQNHDVIDVVACETYLGRPFTTVPTPEVLHQTISECNLIIKKFLKSISSQLPAGTRLCLAVPAWQIRSGRFKHLPILGPDEGGQLDPLTDMGYNRSRLQHVRQEDLLYYRSDQIVARELLVLEKRN